MIFYVLYIFKKITLSLNFANKTICALNSFLVSFIKSEVGAKASPRLQFTSNSYFNLAMLEFKKQWPQTTNSKSKIKILICSNGPNH